MTVYPGAKSLDAEITINFSTKEIEMDYSLNQLGSPYNSNSSAVLYSDWKPIKRILYRTMMIPFTFIYIYFSAFVVPTMTFLSSNGIVKDPRIQYQYQKIFQWIAKTQFGTQTQQVSGPLRENSLELSIPFNLWFEYELTGDFKKQIKSISLKRNFIHKEHFGYTTIRQNGWKVIFDFDSPPQYGICTLRHIPKSI